MKPGTPPEIGQAAKSTDSTRDPQTYAIIGAAMEVHRILGSGFLEPVYQQAMTRELVLRGIPFRREIELPIIYKGHLLEAKYRPDFICHEAVIVELKALDRVGGREKAQVINYLKATGIERGLLLNFGNVRLEYERLILTPRAPFEETAETRDQTP